MLERMAAELAAEAAFVAAAEAAARVVEAARMAAEEAAERQRAYAARIAAERRGEARAAIARDVGRLYWGGKGRARASARRAAGSKLARVFATVAARLRFVRLRTFKALIHCVPTLPLHTLVSHL